MQIRMIGKRRSIETRIVRRDDNVTLRGERSRDQQTFGVIRVREIRYVVALLGRRSMRVHDDRSCARAGGVRTGGNHQRARGGGCLSGGVECVVADLVSVDTALRIDDEIQDSCSRGVHIGEVDQVGGRERSDPRRRVFDQRTRAGHRRLLRLSGVGSVIVVAARGEQQGAAECCK